MFGNIDTILERLSIVSLVVFGILTLIYFIRTVIDKGLIIALLRLFTLRILTPLMLVLGINLLSAALVFIQPPEIGVVISFFTEGGIRNQPMEGGVHFIYPVFEEVKTYPVYWQTYTMSNKQGEGTEWGDDSIRARTRDGQEIRLDTSVIFRIDPEQVVLVHIDWQDRYIEDLIRPLTRGIVRTQVSQFAVNEVNSSQRKDLEITLDRLLKEELASKGLILDKFLLRDITFSEEYADSIERKQVAVEKKEETVHQANQIENLARGNAAAAEIEAYGKAAAIRIEAAAQAEALTLIATALKEDPDLITYHYVDRLSPNIKVMLVPNNVPYILPLPDVADEMNSESGLTTASTSGVTVTLEGVDTLEQPINPTIEPTTP